MVLTPWMSVVAYLQTGRFRLYYGYVSPFEVTQGLGVDGPYWSINRPSMGQSFVSYGAACRLDPDVYDEV